jgi:hypothetical protein
MQRKLINGYTNSAGAFLLAMALMLFLGSLGSAGLLQPRDPVFQIPMLYASWGMGLMALAIAWICLFGRSTKLKLALLLWTGVNLLVFQIGIYSQTHHLNLSGYSAILENVFHLPDYATNWIIKIATVCLLVGSLIAALGLWSTSKNTLKISCPNCGGHVQFGVQAVGGKISCPHCQKIMTLHQVENLKISCYFCHGHIEFPAHAIGEKMPCPHCNKKISLKEPV